MKDNSVAQIIELLNYCRKHNLWCILGFHSILGKEEQGYKNNFTWDLEKYKSLCEQIHRQSNIMSKTTIEYVKEIEPCKAND